MRLLIAAVWTAIRSSRLTTGALLSCSIALGFVPVFKSILESALIGAIDDALSSGNSGNATRPWDTRLSPPSDNTDGVERLASAVVSNGTLTDGLAMYVVVVAAGAGLTVLAAASRGRLSAGFFRQMYAVALTKALGSRKRPDKALNLSSQQATSLQQGATALSETAALTFSVIQVLVAIVSSSLVLFALDKRFLMLFAVIVVALALMSWVQARRLNDKREKWDEQRNELSARADDILTKRELILTHERQDHYRARLDDNAGILTETRRRLTVGEVVFDSLSGGIRDLGLIAVLVLALLTLTGGPPVDGSGVAGAYFFISLYSRLSYNVRALLGYFDDMRRSLSQSRTFLAIVSEPDVPAEAPTDPDSADRPYAIIQFDNVTFAYDDSSAVLSGCSFTVPAGGMTILVGPSGIGKTTIARLVLGFLNPSDGHVRIEGVPTTSYGRAELWAQMSYLPQNAHVLDETVRENLFASDCSERDLSDALKAVGLARDGSLGLLDKSAADLSVGQQQRLAVARLLLDKAPIVIMDEPLAGIDVFTFRDLRPHIEQFLLDRSRTLLVISHRMAFASYARHAIVLGANGQIVEEGMPAVLAAQRSTFAGLLAAARSEVGDLNPDQAPGPAE